MKANQATHSVGVMCRLLQISRSGFYAWLERPASERSRTDLMLTGKIEAIHRRSKGVYGSPNIHAELADDHAIRVGRKRVARLMRAAGLRGATLRRYVVTTQSYRGYATSCWRAPMSRYRHAVCIFLRRVTRRN